MKIRLTSPTDQHATTIETEHHVVMTDVFVGPIFQTADGVCLSVFMRDDGFEFNCWREDGEPDPMGTLPPGAISGSISPYGVEVTS